MTYITKEQFGVELYEAITACAATEQIQRQFAHAQATKLKENGPCTILNMGLPC